MGKSAPDPPPAPDPYATARAQTGSNVSTSIANTVMGNANVVGPTGSTTFKQTGTYNLQEPVLDKDGNQRMTRKWIADPNAQPELQYRQWQPGVTETRTTDDTGPSTISTPGQYIDSRTGQVWNDEGGGRWEETPEMTTRALPQYTQYNELTPDQQHLLDQQELLGQRANNLAIDQVGRLSDVLSKPIDPNALPKGASAFLGPNGLMSVPDFTNGFTPGRADFSGGSMPTADYSGGLLPTADYSGGSMPTVDLRQPLGGEFGMSFAKDLQAPGDVQDIGMGRALLDTFSNSRGVQFDARSPSRNVQYADFGSADRAQRNFAGPSRSIMYDNNLDRAQRDIADVGGPARSAGDFGFENERRRVEEAMLARNMPEMDRQRAQLENQLVNQGFTRGTQAFNAQMDEQIRRENDASLAAILAGGQEQTRMGNLALSRFGAENQAQDQAFGQGVRRGQFANEAIAQDNAATLAQQAAFNAAQGQDFSQSMNRGLFANSAIEQDNRGRLSFLQEGNRAQQQEFDQGIARSDFTNRAQMQDFAQNQSRGQFTNDARSAQQQLAIATANANNQAQQQRFMQQMTAADFERQGRLGQFGADLAGQQLRDSRIGNQFSADMAGQQFRDDRIGNQFSADLAGQQLRDNRIGNQFQADMAFSGLEDGRKTQQFNAQQQAMAAQDAIRQGALQEQFAFQNMPINQISALGGMGQVQMPQFTGFRPSAMSETPVGEYVYQSANIDAANYRAQQAAQGQAMGGLFGMGGQLLGGLAKAGAFAPLLGSDIRIKTDIERIGTLPNSLGVYSYRLKGQTKREIGVMAQEVEKLIPWAVVEIDGIKHVNYAAAVV
jgi:hypothetical protein